MNNENNNDINNEVPSNIPNLIIKINDVSFEVTLYDNKSTRALISLLPLDISMNELNGNEKYYYLENDFPSSPRSVGTINKGDLMLYTSNCLVIFYETFTTSYRYTPLGYINDTSRLSEATSNIGSVDVFIDIKKENN